MSNEHLYFQDILALVEEIEDFKSKAPSDPGNEVVAPLRPAGKME
jgi:hypothetical protein